MRQERTLERLQIPDINSPTPIRAQVAAHRAAAPRLCLDAPAADRVDASQSSPPETFGDHFGRNRTTDDVAPITRNTTITNIGSW